VKRDIDIIARVPAATPDEVKAIDAAATPEAKAKLYGRIIEPVHSPPAN
jgi:hypothetical protein